MTNIIDLALLKPELGLAPISPKRMAHIRRSRFERRFAEWKERRYGLPSK